MLLDGLYHENLWYRMARAYFAFFFLLAAAYFFAFFLLPEGCLKDLPIPSSALLGETGSLLSLRLKTLGYNLLVLGVIVCANHFRVRQFTFGYLPLLADTVILGLFAGSNSFSGPVSAYSLKGWLLFLRIGFLEFSAYIFACVSTTKLAMYHAERWRGQQFRKVRKLKEIALTFQERLVLAISLILLFLAAFNEWSAINPRT
ncbi:MAG: hypothetical protein D6743_12655 [Calditrichaeota bacterium]|nr:MAG: hypothetical protein D6743_12655 [Calditrichota bacterium]